MGTRFGTATLTIGIAAGALAGIAVGAPLLARAAGTTSSAGAAVAPAVDRTADRTAAIKAALAALVTDGTITQAQADAVASTLAGALPAPRGYRDYRDYRGWMDGMGGMGGPEMRGMAGLRGLMHDSLDAAASALGMTSEQVRQGLAAGRSLAALAKEKGIATSTLVDDLVAEANRRIDRAVQDARITAAQAAALKSGVRTRIDALVNGRMPMRHLDRPAPAWADR